MNKKKMLAATLMTTVLTVPIAVKPVMSMASDFYLNQNNAQSADITNWVANTPTQISNNMNNQHIDVNNLHGTRYIIQWGDTLSGISAATGISVRKLAYDNHITNINLIYAGDVLILNRDGSVPSDFNYTGNGNDVAQTRVTINYYDNSTNINAKKITKINQQIINNSPVSIKDSGNKVENNNNTDSNVSSTSSQYSAPKSLSVGIKTKDSSNNNSSSSNSSASSSSSSSSNVSSTLSSSSNDSKQNNSSSISSSNDSKSSKDNDSSSSSSTSEMSNNDFADQVQSDVNNILSDNINFESHSGNDSDSDQQSSNLYDSDQSIDLNDTKMTNDTAQKLAQKIADQLKNDNKLDDLKSADSAQINISTSDNGFKFNITVNKNSSSSSDSSSDSSSSSDSNSSLDSNSDTDSNNQNSDNDNGNNNNSVDTNNDNTDDDNN